MRVLTGVIITGTLLATVPSVARAAETPMCVYSGSGGERLSERLNPFLNSDSDGKTTRGGEAGAAIEAVFGTQYVKLWVDIPRAGWSVAFSPGPHDGTTARAAISEHLRTLVSAADHDFLMGTLTLLPTPYSAAELNAVMDELFPLMTDEASIVSGLGQDCDFSDGVRVQVGVTLPDTPESRARSAALLAAYGDKVRVRFGVPKPTGEAHALAPRVRSFVSLPKTSRCVRGSTLTAKPRAGVARLRLSAGARTVVARGGKPARLKLKARRTKVTVTVTLKGGSRAVQTFTYRRCA